MYQQFAEILGRHAASVIKSMSGLKAISIKTVPVANDEGPRYNLGVRVDFKGSSESGRGISGFFICVFDTFEAAQSISRNIALNLGLEASQSDTRDGVDNFIGEYLNIVIGLTCSDWAELGLRLDFNPPEKLTEHQITTVSAGAKAFHLILETQNNTCLSIFLDFFADPA